MDYFSVFVGLRSGSITLQIVRPLAFSKLVLLPRVTHFVKPSFEHNVVPVLEPSCEARQPNPQVYYQQLQHRGREFSEMFCKRCFISASPKRVPNTWAKLVCRTALCVLPPATRLTLLLKTVPQGVRNATAPCARCICRSSTRRGCCK